MYLWLKALHIIAVISWMAGLLYLPRLFVYHAQATPGSDQSETFKVMERRLYKFIMMPAMIVAWLIGIVRNACHDHHRRQSTLQRLKGHLAVFADMAAPPDGRDLFRRSWLASELARLSPLLRETVVLVVGEGLTHAEAATVLGVTESTISGRLHEVRRQAGLAKDIGDE